MPIIYDERTHDVPALRQPKGEPDVPAAPTGKGGEMTKQV